MLLVMTKSPLRKAIRQELQTRGASYRLGSPGSDDLFERALDQGAIIYAPAPSLLRGALGPKPEADRMRAVLGAASAPGCTTVVVVVPRGSGYDPEIEVLRRVGKPFVVVSAPPLIEEIGAELAADGTRSLWLPRSGRVEAARAEDVARAVLAAVETEYQGRVEPVHGVEMDLPELFELAAEVTHRRVHIHAVWPPLHRALWPVLRWASGREPNGLALASALERPPLRP